MNSFGVAIPVNGPGNGFVGSPTRMGDRDIVSKIVSSSASAAGLPFGSGAVEISNPTGGAWLSFADFLATATNAALLEQQFAGVTVRNVKTQYGYQTMITGGTTVVTATATGTVATDTITVSGASGTITVGMTVDGTGVASGSVVTNVNGSTITLSQNLLQSITSSAVSFTQVTPQGVVGFFSAGQMADVGLRGSINVLINAGTPQANLPVYIRTVANANTPGTSVGDFEAASETGATTTGSATLGSTSMTVASATGVAVGCMVSGTGIPVNTYVTAVSGTTITLSQAVTATISSAAVVFYNTALLGSATDPWIVFRTGAADPTNNSVFEITIKNRHAA